MRQLREAVAAGPWVPVVVSVVAGPGAIRPFRPSEATVVACGVATASTRWPSPGRPSPGLPVVVAAAGACAGGRTSFRTGRRSTGVIAARLTHRRTRAVHARVHRRHR
ncbi:hypothetical protein Ari01nite_60840 [Paractinoplanes rishiriensis]|uniref:Uncharacterized protein n=1 Tax=Paractinoplanes rishiriensis TaxID=1050105 RepID=A0A919MXJ1_9ACTN|nr:hypothetical protein Ari01nite_60840 [Actinoplanes rishiriensis]